MAAAKKKAAARTRKSASRKARGVAVAGEGASGLRVRMYRVGFGDFFLVTVPTDAGKKHILIDCGVHAKDLGSIEDAVAQMARDSGSELALLIVTHRHADHISGFGRCRDVFRGFTVERVWMSWFEDPGNKDAVALQASLTAAAARVSLQLAARDDPESRRLAAMADNVTGGVMAAGKLGNEVALDVLHNGFENKPAYDYYQAGDTPRLPPDLAAAGLSAQILGPPLDPSLVAQMTRKNQQYLGAAGDADEGTDGDQGPLFPKTLQVDRDDYAGQTEGAITADALDAAMKSVDESQPDALAARARAMDNTLNNQSLVVLFTFRGKNLLFAGDAQWGSWENFLYGGAYGTPGHTQLTDRAKQILGRLDFYKVGHHGSANATPRDAVAAMRDGCVGMCSTEPKAYNEVPRAPLLQALGEKMRGQLARSDQVPVEGKPPSPGVGRLPSRFKDPTGALFIDCEL